MSHNEKLTNFNYNTMQKRAKKNRPVALSLGMAGCKVAFSWPLGT